jgi:hypothetical protein
MENVNHDALMRVALQQESCARPVTDIRQQVLFAQY